jgi:hypothetical protein
MVSFMSVAKPFESLAATAEWVALICTSKGETNMCKIDRYAAVLIVFLQIPFRGMGQDLDEILSRFPISQPGLLAVETNECLCSGILWESWRHFLPTNRNEGRTFVDELVEAHGLATWTANILPKMAL